MAEALLRDGSLGQPYISSPRLAQLTGKSGPAVRRALLGLVSKGAIERVGKGTRGVIRWRICEPESPDDLAASGQVNTDDLAASGQVNTDDLAASGQVAGRESAAERARAREKVLKSPAGAAAQERASPPGQGQEREKMPGRQAVEPSESEVDPVFGKGVAEGQRSTEVAAGIHSRGFTACLKEGQGPRPRPVAAQAPAVAEPRPPYHNPAPVPAPVPDGFTGEVHPELARRARKSRARRGVNPDLPADPAELRKIGMRLPGR